MCERQSTAQERTAGLAPLLMPHPLRAASSGLGHFTVSGCATRWVLCRPHIQHGLVHPSLHGWPEEQPACCRPPHILYFTPIHRQPSVSPTGAACRQRLDPTENRMGRAGLGLLQVQAEGEASTRWAPSLRSQL